ncbi:MAG TPA: hypothetical protein VI895_06045 [Bdellovibrionota bacterium]|nr:hypothetical protein [Bdellovibrionota bacterium]
MKRARWVIPLIVLPTLAAAFVPPPSFVINKWVGRTKSVRTIHVRQKTTLYENGQPAGSLDEELWMKRPGLYRKTMSYAQGNVDWIVGPQKAGRLFQGKFDVVPPMEVMGAAGLFYVYGDSKRLTAGFRQAGVTSDVARWVLRDREVGFEIGDAAGSRVIFAKNENRPMAAELGGKSHRFSISNPPRFRIPYPEIIEVSVQGKLTERTEITSVDVDGPIADSLFEVRSASPKR